MGEIQFLVHIFTARDRWSLEPHAWVEDLLKDFFQSILGINLSVILLSPTECLIFCGNRTQGQGMSWDESLHYAHQLTGVHPWTSYMIEVVTHQWTLKEAWHEMQVARKFTHERTKQSLSFECLGYGPSSEGPTGHAPEIAQGARHDGAGRPILCPTAVKRDESRGAHLCAVPYPVGRSTGEPRAWTVRFCPGRRWRRRRQNQVSTLDAELDASMGKEMDASGCPARTSSAEWHHRRNRAMHRERTRVRREFWRPKNRCLSFPLFRETTKEDAISYRDWCSEIEDALEHGHNAPKVKEAMFASLEGMAQDNAKMIDENGDLHVTCILDGFDSLYGVSMTFQSLNAALCGLQQRQMESTRTYYNCMAQITIILREHHSNR